MKSVMERLLAKRKLMERDLLAFTKISFRNLSRRKLRTTLVIVALCLSVALVAGINMGIDSAETAFRKYISAAVGEVDIVVMHGLSGEGFNQTVVEEVMDVKGVSEIAWRLQGWGYFYLENESRPIGFGIQGVNVTGDFDYASYDITGTRELEGYDVVVEQRLGEVLNVTIGSELNVTLYRRTEEPRFSEANYTFRIVGICHETSWRVRSNFFGELSMVQEMINSSGLITSILVKVENYEETLEVQKRIEEKLGLDYDVFLPKYSQMMRFKENTQGFRYLLYFMSAIAVVVCIFVTFNTMLMSVSERTYEIGVLRAVGTSRLQVFKMILFESIFIGLIGATVGLPIGVGLFNVLAHFVTKSFNINVEVPMTFTPAFFIGAVIGVLAAMLGALYPALKASRLDVVRALRPAMRVSQEPRKRIIYIAVAGVSMFSIGFYLTVQSFTAIIMFGLGLATLLLGSILVGAVILKKTSGTISRVLLPFSKGIGIIVSKSAGRNLIRSTVCLGMVALWVSFQVALSGIRVGAVTGMEQLMRENFGADIYVIGNRPLPVSFSENLTNIEGVEVATSISSVARVKIANRTSSILFIQPSTFTEIIKLEFSEESETPYQKLSESNETIILGPTLAELLDAKVGDKLEVLTRKGRVNFTVVGIVVSGGLQYFTLGTRSLSESGILSLNSSEQYFKAYQTGIFLVKVKPEYKGKVQEVLENIDEAYPNYGFTRLSTTIETILKDVESQIQKIFIIFSALLLFSLLIASLGIASTMIMSVIERKQEIGILRAEGASKGQVFLMITSEATMLSLVGFIVGMFAGPIILVGATNIATNMGFQMPYILSGRIIAYSLFLILLFTIMGALFPAYRASKITVAEALRR